MESSDQTVSRLPENAGLEVRWLETLLRRETFSKGAERVLSMDVEPAVAKGENFMSQMVRVKMRVVLGSGRITSRSVIVKRIPDNGFVSKFVSESLAFHTEIYMYNSVFPMMEKLMETHNDTSERIWCECLDCTPYTQLVLEDLKVCGFSMADRKFGMDLDHAVLALRSLAKFHAMTYSLIDSGNIELNRLLPVYMARNMPHINNLFGGGFITLVDVMRDSWGPEWAAVADKLEAIRRTLGDRLQETILGGTPKFQVLNHGDCWVNNIMFKYDTCTQRPISVRFVDFQGPSYNTPALDISYFLHSSLLQKVKREHFSDLVRTYCSSLKHWLNFYGHEIPPHLPTPEDIESEMRRLALVGLAVVVSVKPLMKTEEESMGKHEGTHPQTPDMYADPDILEVIREDVPKLLAHIQL